MATYVLGGIILLAFAMGLRHIYRNFSSGHSDCCGSGGGCSGGCSHCNSKR